ncbi:MAG: DNA-binding protein WhiA [Lachnospiraceae bacterium]|nr:DNA-binding protein WhiA [Lachnospiraceae bacterium]
MSFSQTIKEELSGHIGQGRHCQLAELAALLHFCGQYRRDRSGGYAIGFQTENVAVSKKGFTLLNKTFNINTGAEISEEQMREVFAKIGDLAEPVDPLLLKNSCCQRAFLRGAFLSVGSISDPAKGYHLEFVCASAQKAEQIQRVLLNFEIEAKIVLRKKYHVVYLKEGERIVDLLNVCEAHVALMEFENLRILKEMRNSINRRVNCEAANITKTVNASSRQIEDIVYIRDHGGFGHLPEGLRQMAEVRLEHADASLKELGTYLDPPVGKSGVNHRLHKLSEIAEKLRT